MKRTQLKITALALSATMIISSGAFWMNSAAKAEKATTTITSEISGETAGAVTYDTKNVKKNIKAATQNGKKKKVMMLDLKLPTNIVVEGNEESSQKINQYYKEKKAEYITTAKQYRKDAKQLYKSSPALFKQGNCYAFTSEYTVQATGSVLSVSTTDYVNQMGAHPSMVYNGEVFNTKTGDKLTLSDFFDFKDEAVSKALIDYVQAQLKKEYQVENLEEVLFETVNFTDYFGSKATGCTFSLKENGHFELIFNQYEIAPYAFGAPMIELDDSIMALMTENGKALLGC